MKPFTSTLLACALILVAANSAFSQTEQTEKLLTDAGGGYSFTPPKGFNAEKSDEGFGLVNQAQTIIIAVKSHEFETFEKFMAQSNLDEDGFVLVGKVVDIGEKGKAFSVTKSRPQGALFVTTYVLFSPFGGGIIIAAISDMANRIGGIEAGSKIAGSVTFTKPQESEAGSQWQNFFSGKHLLYLYTASGFSERTDIYLCPSGEFSFRSNTSSVSNSGTGALGSNSDGRWKISSRSGVTLILQFRNGAVREYKVAHRQAGNEIGLNGNRYFVQTQNVCR